MGGVNLKMAFTMADQMEFHSSLKGYLFYYILVGSYEIFLSVHICDQNPET